MARIRTIKPDFFSHWALYQLEKETKLPCRLAFAGLWTVADREGRFRWIPQQLKIGCLPYDDVDFSRVLDALATRDFIVKYRVDSIDYGYIPSWNTHQVINNRESDSLLPEPNEINTLTCEARVDHASATREVHALVEGKGREGKGREGKGREGKGIIAINGDSDNQFDEIRLAYPRRGGGQKWGDAEKAYKKRLAQKHTHEEILAGVKRYKDYLIATGSIGTQYVQQAATFLGENKGFLEPWIPPAEVKDVRQLSALERVQLAASKVRGQHDERVVSEQTGSGFGSLEELMRDVR
ncbi:MAG: hypothetical protein ACO294_10975 [Methylococcales bacterium]